MIKKMTATTPVIAMASFGSTLQERFHLLEAVVEGTADGVYVKDLDGRYLMINRAGASMIGRTVEEVLARTDAELTDARSTASSVEMDRLVMATGESITYDEDPLVDGQLPSFVTTKAPYRDEDGTIIGVLGRTCESVRRTHGEDAEQNANTSMLELSARERTAELEASMAELETFSYSVSHDLRAPLRAINGYAAVLREESADALGPGGTHALSAIMRGAQRMGELIDALLKFSRLGRREMERQDADMGEIVRSVVAELRASEPGHQPQVTIRELGTARCDPTTIRQVFANLLSNAWKFTSKTPEPTIEIDRANEGDDVVFVVHDNGVGFDERHQGKLFEVFQRLHSEAEFPGTGIGLALVRRIVKRHGGDVHAESHAGEGATFSFSLPTQGETS
jgi:PAS domain S-box-containing protein